MKQIFIKCLKTGGITLAGKPIAKDEYYQIPADTILRAVYKNVSGASKKFKFMIEYLY